VIVCAPPSNCVALVVNVAVAVPPTFTSALLGPSVVPPSLNVSVPVGSTVP
jgi:hypothetical protein